jgi:hypothetical protein
MHQAFLDREVYLLQVCPSSSLAPSQTGPYADTTLLYAWCSFEWKTQGNIAAHSTFQSFCFLPHLPLPRPLLPLLCVSPLRLDFPYKTLLLNTFHCLPHSHHGAPRGQEQGQGGCLLPRDRRTVDCRLLWPRLHVSVPVPS